MPAVDKERRKTWSREYYKTWRRKNPEQYLYNSAKSRAKKKGLPFDIEVSDVVIPTHCPVLGIPLEASDDRWSPNSPSLDRIRNEDGYVKGNVSVISMKANTCKRELTTEEIGALYRYVSGLENTTP